MIMINLLLHRVANQSSGDGHSGRPGKKKCVRDLFIVPFMMMMLSFFRPSLAQSLEGITVRECMQES